MGHAAQATVRPACPEDVARVAELHASAIDEGFLAALGPRFLRRLYHRVLKSPHGFVEVVDDGDDAGAPAGFVAGATDVGRLYREFLRRDGLPAALGSAPRLARSAPRALETLRYGTSGAETGPASPGAPEAELLALAVEAGHRRRGLGGALIQAFLASAARSGAVSARVVVGADNRGAIARYRAAGFEVARTLEVHAGTSSLVLRTALTRPPGR